MKTNISDEVEAKRAAAAQPLRQRGHQQAAQDRAGGKQHRRRTRRVAPLSAALCPPVASYVTEDGTYTDPAQSPTIEISSSAAFTTSAGGTRRRTARRTPRALHALHAGDALFPARGLAHAIAYECDQQRGRPPTANTARQPYGADRIVHDRRQKGSDIVARVHPRGALPAARFRPFLGDEHPAQRPFAADPTPARKRNAASCHTLVAAQPRNVKSE